MAHKTQTIICPTSLRWSPNVDAQGNPDSNGGHCFVTLGLYGWNQKTEKEGWYVIVRGGDDTSVQTVSIPYCDALDIFRSIVSTPIVTREIVDKYFKGSSQNNGYPS